MTSKVNSGFPLLTPSLLLRRFISEYLTLYEEKEKKKTYLWGRGNTIKILQFRII